MNDKAPARSFGQRDLTPVRAHNTIFAVQDDCLVTMSSAEPYLDMTQVRRLPPWRAVMIARIGHKAGMIDRRTLDELVREATLVTGQGVLKNDG